MTQKCLLETIIVVTTLGNPSIKLPLFMTQFNVPKISNTWTVINNDIIMVHIAAKNKI